MKKLIFTLAAAFAGIQAQAADSAWKYFFYISGDYYYSGPTVRGEQLKDEDQAWVTYEKIRQLASGDHANDYIIFFDPRKRSNFLFSTHKIRFDIFHEGRQVYRNKIFKKDVDSTSPETFRNFFDVAQSKLPGESRQTLFFYYGEHLPNRDVPYVNDLSHPESSFYLAKFIEGLSYAGRPFDVLIMQSCVNNNLDFVEALAGRARHVILPAGNVSRSYLNLDFIKDYQGESKDFIAQFLDRAQHSSLPHPYRDFGSSEEILQAASGIRSLFHLLDIGRVKNELQGLKNELIGMAKESMGAERSLHVQQFNDDVYVLASGEVLVNLADYLNFLLRKIPARREPEVEKFIMQIPEGGPLAEELLVHLE